MRMPALRAAPRLLEVMLPADRSQEQASILIMWARVLVGRRHFC
ncbi:unnamed protein product, partial [Amoebophrya sp. A25]|eukprot:GSA25T00004940001.1